MMGFDNPFYHQESRWRISHVLGYHGLLQIATFGELRGCAIYFHHSVIIPSLSLNNQHKNLPYQSTRRKGPLIRRVSSGGGSTNSTPRGNCWWWSVTQVGGACKVGGLVYIYIYISYVYCILNIIDIHVHIYIYLYIYVCKYLDGRIFRKKGCISLYVCHNRGTLSWFLSYKTNQ